MTSPAKGPHLMPASPNYQIAHYNLDESGVTNPPTVGDLQLQLTTALQTVDELTSEVKRLANVNGTLHRTLEDREAKIIELREALQRAESGLTAANASRIDAETAMACALKARETAQKEVDVVEAENKRISDELARANSMICGAKSALNG